MRVSALRTYDPWAELSDAIEQDKARDALLRPRCDVECCGVAAVVRARKLFGDGGTLLLCEQHRPKRTPGLPFAYEVTSC